MLEREREREITGCRRAVIGAGDGGESCDSAKMEVMERCVRYRVMMVFTVFQFLIVDFALFVDSFFYYYIAKSELDRCCSANRMRWIFGLLTYEMSLVYLCRDKGDAG